ncbi:hypothetical protein ACLKA6_007656 [Drosophila palustris]
MDLARKIILWIIPIFVLGFLLTLSEAYLHPAEIPFKRPTVGLLARNLSQNRRSSGIHLISSLEHQRTFLNIFQVPYMLCYYAARGKWPYVPGFMKSRVNSAAKGFFNQNDSYIQNFCTKWIEVKECFRPNYDKNTNSFVETLDSQKQIQNCNCDKMPKDPVVYFDKNYIGNVSSETILTTIDFLESFLPPPTKKQKNKKNRVRGRVDEIDIE